MRIANVWLPGAKTWAPLRTAKPHISPTTTYPTVVVFNESHRLFTSGVIRTASLTVWWGFTLYLCLESVLSRCSLIFFITASVEDLIVLTLKTSWKEDGNRKDDITWQLCQLEVFSTISKSQSQIFWIHFAYWCSQENVELLQDQKTQVIHC